VNKVHQFEIYRLPHPTVVVTKIPVPFLVPIAFSHCNVFSESADLQNQHFSKCIWHRSTWTKRICRPRRDRCTIKGIFQPSLTFGQLLQNDKAVRICFIHRHNPATTGDKLQLLEKKEKLLRTK
jgi:hypothetical protein